MCECNCNRRVIETTCDCKKQQSDCGANIGGGAIVGGIIGALLGGPVGAVIGAGLGGAAGASTCDDENK